MTDLRRRIPPTDEVLARPEFVTAAERLGRDAVKRVVVATQQRARSGEVEPEAVPELALAALPGRATTMQPVINATGVLVHTNLGRAPLSAAAREAMVAVTGPTDVEFDLRSGKRARRGRGALAALAAAVPAAAGVHVVNNNAAALLLCALVLAKDREIVVSRGELVEIGDGFRIPELLASTGARLREVGTTNRTSLRDYADAIGPQTAFVLKVHPSNFQVAGFTAAVDVPELVGLGVPVVVDIGSGLLRPHPVLPDEPDATTVLRAGAALVTASGDKLLGGPQAGLLLGDEPLVQRLRSHPSARALRVDKLTLAALEATLDGPQVPVREQLECPVAQVRERVDRLVRRLVAADIDARAAESTAVVGGGGAPGAQVPSAAVSLPASYAESLRAADQPVVGYVDHGRCLLDLRTVPPVDDDALYHVIRVVQHG